MQSSAPEKTYLRSSMHTIYDVWSEVHNKL